MDSKLSNGYSRYNDFLGRGVLALYVSYFLTILTVAVANDFGVLEYILWTESKNSGIIYIGYASLALLFLIIRSMNGFSFIAKKFQTNGKGKQPIARHS
jgi:hypothetical protein